MGGMPMDVHEFTEEERETLIDEAFKGMGIERKHLSRADLEKEIIDYLGKTQPCSLATCGKDGVPRIAVTDYVNEGLVIYIFSEGGDKFKNLRENNRVAIGIGTSAKTVRSVRGVNLWGCAEVFTEDTPEFAHGMKLFKPILREQEQEVGFPIELPKGTVRMIRITPTKIVYHHNNKGIANAQWEAQ
jgi:hypothetical protein